MRLHSARVSPLFGGYDGYADASVTWNLPSVNSAGVVEVVGSVKIFRPTDSSNPQTMYGVVMKDSASINLLGAAPFDGNVGIPMQSRVEYDHARAVLPACDRVRRGDGGLLTFLCHTVSNPRLYDKI